MAEFVLEVTKREQFRKEASKRYRRSGMIPACIYGQEDNKNVLVNSRDFNRMYPKLTKSTVIDLKLDGKDLEVLIKDYQKNYVKDEFYHLDFYELKKGKTLHLTIPLEFVGTPAGIRDGGILQKHLDKLEVECLPKDIVSSFKVDISGLELNGNMHVKDLKLDAKYKIRTHLDEVMVVLSGSGKEEAEEKTAAAPAAAAPAATPEKK